ncbi:peptidoglycan DD-metalloendopeptidase family protein [Streptomyces sp. NBC_00239]|uniref:peptidoglycan DD-metalloendopeptidase family protein n=1 Tax=Streptomyces sp. NBC_00239 TaxID=2903640 RepID=UPI002E2C092B|nr:peptidoglycan DD-metalloendopeptidase family protein [Streptomyces sp. NBC_00239]
MSLKKGIALAAGVGFGVPLVFGVGIVFAASGDDDGAGGGGGGGGIVAGGKLRVGKGFVPAKYAALIEKAAADCDQGLSPGILAAQIQAESNFDPSATSYEYVRDANGNIIKKIPLAKGISQFIDDTWASQGIDGNGDGVKDVRDPEDAIPSQGRMMCDLVKKAKKYGHYNGSPIELALSGYNAGWGWVDYFKGVPPARFAEGQTYNYVRDIMKNAANLTMPDSGGGKLSSEGWTLPVSGAAGTPYGQKGSAWSSGYHTGVDFPVPTGTVIKAAGPGVVHSAGWAGAYGYEVVIKHDDGKYSQYAHMAGTPPVQAGQKVEGGQQIGVSGETGNTFGPHLHFEIRTGPGYGTDVSPIAYLRTRGVNV